MTDFAPVALLAQVPIVLMVRKDLPAKDFKEFVAYAKANQAKMQYGSAGAGSATHLGCVLLNYILGVDITHIPFNGTGPAMGELHAGRIDYLCEIMSTAKPQIDSGSVRALAIFDAQRSPALPDVPTRRSRAPRIEAYTWNAIFLPKRHAAGRRRAPQQGGGRGHRDAGCAGAAGKARRRCGGGRAQHAEISRLAGQERDREMGGADQGERRVRRVTERPFAETAA